MKCKLVERACVFFDCENCTSKALNGFATAVFAESKQLLKDKTNRS